LFALKAAQGAELITLDWMHARRPAFAAADMQSTGIEFDLVPLQIAGFGRPKTMAVCDQDHFGTSKSKAGCA
jgi:hypothetical protein